MLIQLEEKVLAVLHIGCLVTLTVVQNGEGYLFSLPFCPPPVLSIAWRLWLFKTPRAFNNLKAPNLIFKVSWQHIFFGEKCCTFSFFEGAKCDWVFFSSFVEGDCILGIYMAYCHHTWAPHSLILSRPLKGRKLLLPYFMNGQWSTEKLFPPASHRKLVVDLGCEPGSRLVA